MKRNVLSVRWPTRRLRAEELDIILGEFKEHLVQQGYALSSLRHYVGVAEHFGRWMHLKQYRLREVDESLITRFRQRHLPWCQWLRYLRLRKLCPLPPQSGFPLVDRQVRSFDIFLREVRGLTEATRRYDRRHIR